MCFTYGCWFGCCGLAALGHTCQSDDALRRCCAFLVGVQQEDGGWGESYLSCQDKVRFGRWWLVVGMGWLAVGGFMGVQQDDDGGWGEGYLSCQDKVRRGWWLAVGGWGLGG